VKSSRETQSSTRKRDEHLSKDGQWRSFPKVPHLLQCVSNGKYYGRIKTGGKVICENLQTAVWTTAKVRLVDFLKDVKDDLNNRAAHSNLDLMHSTSAHGRPTINFEAHAYGVRS
jgi:hypothetical protein